MTITTSNKSLIALIKDFKNIHDAKDLRRRKLTVANHFEIEGSIQELYNNGTTTTISGEVADHYKKFGLNVTQDDIGWCATLD